MSTPETDDAEEYDPESVLVAVMDTEAQVHIGAREPEPVKAALDGVFHDTAMLPDDTLAAPTREWQDDRQDLAAVLRDWHKRVAVGETYSARLWPHDVVTVLGGIARWETFATNPDPDGVEAATEAWSSAFAAVREMVDGEVAFSQQEAKEQVISVLDGIRDEPDMDMARQVDSKRTRR